MKEAVIEARDISKQYKELAALDRVDITVHQGDIYGLIGDNGAGKSTFLKIVTGQIFPTCGYVRLFGCEDVKTVQKNRSRMGALVENAGFFPKMSVQKNMEYFRIQRGIPGKQKAEEALRTVNLWEKRNVKCEKLSMGMKQRFGLALALLGEPELLVLDEPINGLDPRDAHTFDEIESGKADYDPAVQPYPGGARTDRNGVRIPELWQCAARNLCKGTA